MPPASPRPLARPLLRRKLRAGLLWAAFALAAVAATVAVHRLYDTVRRELATQSSQALAQALATAQERVQAETDAARLATIKTLAAFHVEGLGHALQRWDDSDPAVVGTFQWDAARGFLPGVATPAELAALWQRFRATRASAGNTVAAERHGNIQSLYFPTASNPRLPSAELGYQAENLEMLTYAGRIADPWAGWAARTDDPNAPWIFWYQTGPDAGVRGCFVDPSPRVTAIRRSFGNGQLAQLDLVADAPRVRLARDATYASLAPHLPGYGLLAREGTVFAAKQSSARLAALAVVLLLGVFLLGALALMLFSRRDSRDAERKTTFVTQVSHELRTPLTSIQMFADMLATPGLPDEKRAKFAGTISRETHRLSALIERLLTFNALEKSSAPTAVAPLDVVAVLRETVEEMEATLHAAGMTVETDFPGEPLVALTDRSTLKQALLNLLDNARKYASEGKTIRLAAARHGNVVAITVADRGPGVPRELGDRAFEPFVQGGRTLSDKSPGVGLGLSIARGLLRQAGGDLLLVPSPVGACFEIRLPHASPA